MIWGLLLPIAIGTGDTGPTMREAFTSTVEPLRLTSSPARRPRMSVMASRRCATGRGYVWPSASRPAPTPIPRNARPSLASCSVAMMPAITAGWREYGLVTIGPSWMRDVSRATRPSSTKQSGQKITSLMPTRLKPASSASRARYTTSRLVIPGEISASKVSSGTLPSLGLMSRT